MLGFIKRLFKRNKQEAPVTNQSCGVFFIYPEVGRDRPQRCPPTPPRVVTYLAEVAERKRQWQEWRENNAMLFGVA